MKCYSVFIFLMCVTATFGQSYFGFGRITPGQFILGYAYNSTSVTATPQLQNIEVTFRASPGFDITFVHANCFPVNQHIRARSLENLDEFFVLF